MKRGRSTGTPTKAEAARMAAIKDCGCVIAYALGLSTPEQPVPCEVQHLTTGGKHGQKRLGHMATVGLNRWSHRGIPLSEYGWDAKRCRIRLGPSLALEPRAFREEWPDSRLLQLQAELLGEAAA